MGCDHPEGILDLLACTAPPLVLNLMLFRMFHYFPPVGKEFKPDAAIINQVIKTGVKAQFSLSFEVDRKYPREAVDRMVLSVLYESGGGDSARIENIPGGCLVELGSNVSEMELKEMKSKFLERLEEYHSMAGVQGF